MNIRKRFGLCALAAGAILGALTPKAEAKAILEVPVFPLALGQTAAVGLLFGSKFFVGPSVYYAFGASSRYAFGIKTRYFLNGKPMTTSFVIGPEAHYTSISSSLGTAVSAAFGFGSHLQLGKRFAVIALMKAGTAFRLSGTGANLDLFTPMTGNSFYFNAELSLAFTFGS